MAPSSPAPDPRTLSVPMALTLAMGGALLALGAAFVALAGDMPTGSPSPSAMR